MSSSALWAALGAGTDTVATGISEERKAAKEAAALAEKQAYQAGLLADERAIDEKRRGEDVAYRTSEAEARRLQREADDKYKNKTFSAQQGHNKLMQSKADKEFEHKLTREQEQDKRAVENHALALAKEQTKITNAAEKLKAQNEYKTFEVLMDKDERDLSPQQKRARDMMFRKFTGYNISEAKKKGTLASWYDAIKNVLSSSPPEQSEGVTSVLNAKPTGVNAVVDLGATSNTYMSDGDNMSIENPKKPGEFVNARLTYAQGSGSSLDAFETAKSEEWLKKPANAKKMELQREAAAKVLGKDVSEVTNEDIFRLGDKGTDAMRGAVSAGQNSYPLEEGPSLRFDAKVGLLNDKDKSGGGRPLITATNAQGKNVADIVNTRDTNSSFDGKYNSKARERLAGVKGNDSAPTAPVNVKEAGILNGSVPTVDDIKVKDGWIPNVKTEADIVDLFVKENPDEADMSNKTSLVAKAKQYYTGSIDDRISTISEKLYQMKSFIKGKSSGKTFDKYNNQIKELEQEQTYLKLLQFKQE